MHNQNLNQAQSYTATRVPQQQAFAGQNFQTSAVGHPNQGRMATAWNYRFQPNTQAGQSFNQRQTQAAGGQFMQTGAAFGAQNANAILQPSIDISETKDELVVACNMQNVDANNLNLTATEDSLSISAQSYVANQPTNLHKTIPLPTSIRAEAVNADYSNGILNVRMPKKDASARKQLQVNINE